MTELKIRGPDKVEDIYDIIIYLSTSSNNADRICFKRFTAKELLDPKKSLDIERHTLEEDKSVDPLDDEQFPGMIFMRMKMFDEDPIEFKKDLFKGDEHKS